MVQSMDPSSSPLGQMGLIVASLFLIGVLLVEMWFWLFRVPLHFNSNLVVLNPNIPSADSVSQLRPNTLANFVFKIITQILTYRLRPIAPNSYF